VARLWLLPSKGTRGASCVCGPDGTPALCICVSSVLQYASISPNSPQHPHCNTRHTLTQVRDAPASICVLCCNVSACQKVCVPVCECVDDLIRSVGVGRRGKIGGAIVRLSLQPNLQVDFNTVLTRSQPSRLGWVLVLSPSVAALSPCVAAADWTPPPHITHENTSKSSQV
jgi:hypothetical protein